MVISEYVEEKNNSRKIIIIEKHL